MPQSYFVEGLFPHNRTSLICGPSGAGKSRWLLAMIADWIEGKSILNRKSFPRPCCFITCDRPKESTFEVIESLGLQDRLPPSKLPIYSLMDPHRSFDIKEIGPMVGPSPRVLFIEAFQALTPDTNGYWPVLNFFREWNQVCQTNNWSVLASCHSPKQKRGEGYSLHRDRIMGSMAWGAAVEGIVTLDYSQPEVLECTKRDLAVLPRNSAPSRLLMDFDHRGYVVEAKDEDIGQVLLLQELRKLPDQSIITTQICRNWAQANSVSESTMFRFLRDCPHLSQIKKKFYRYSAELTEEQLNPKKN